jgi:hypothetical protein
MSHRRAVAEQRGVREVLRQGRPADAAWKELGRGRLHGRAAERLRDARSRGGRRARHTQRRVVITDDEIRSLVISQRLLGTREIVLIHHTDCGMLTFEDDEVKGQIQADVGIKPEFALEAFSDLEEDVRQSVARIEASPFIPHKDSVRGFIYEVETGRLREVG